MNHTLAYLAKWGLYRTNFVHSGNLTWQWKMDPLKMYFLLNMGIFHCYGTLPEGSMICRLASHDLSYKHHFSPGSADCTIRIWECSKKRQLKVSNVFFPLVFGTAVAVVDEGRRLESFQKTGRNEWDYDKDLHNFAEKPTYPHPDLAPLVSGNDRPKRFQDI